MLGGEDLGSGLALGHPQLPDPMRPSPPHMVWTGLGIAIAAHYINILLTSEMLIVEGPPHPWNTLLHEVSQWGC